MTSEPEVLDKPAPAILGGVVAYLSVGDANAAGEFYKRAFAAEEVNRVPGQDGKRLMHLHLRINGGSLLVMDFFPEHGHVHKEPGAFTLHLQVDDADAWFKRAADAGAEIEMPIQDMFWGDRYGQVKDPWGVIWAMGTPLKR